MDQDELLKDQTFVKAMSILPLGTIKEVHNSAKHLIVLFSFFISIVGVVVALIQYRYSKFNQKRMLKDMVSLQKAENQIHELQRELDKVKMEASQGTSNTLINTDHQHSPYQLTRQSGNHPMDELNTKSHPNDSGIKESDTEWFNCYNSVTDSGLDYSRLNELEEELRQTREQLQRAETALANKSWAPPHQLQLWLQLTHELELNHYIAKRQAAENQLTAAKEGCEKLKKKRSTFFGSLRVAHGSSIDDVDNRILQAKQALSEITKELKERLYRWQQIEYLCGFSIVHNRGIAQIQSEIFATLNKPSAVELHRSMSEAFIVDTETETLTLSRSPGITRYGFNQRSLRSSRSSDHKSSFSTSSTSASHHQSHHKGHSQHNYLHTQLSRAEPNNGTLETNNHNESTADDESSGSDLDITSSASHHLHSTSYNHQPQNPNSYHSPPQLVSSPPPSFNHDKVIFTLGDGVLDQDLSLVEDHSFQPHHRRSWSSIRRAPRRSGRGRESKTIEISKSLSIVDGKTEVKSTVEQQDGRRSETDNHQRKSSSRVSYGDTTEMKEAVKQDTQNEPASSTDEDGTEKSTESTEMKKTEDKNDPQNQDKNGASPTQLSSHSKHSISTYIRGARRSFKFMNNKLKRSSTDNTFKSAENDEDKSQVD